MLEQNVNQRFQSPSGDSLFSDTQEGWSLANTGTRFNPLAGIRCFLTQ